MASPWACTGASSNNPSVIYWILLLSTTSAGGTLHSVANLSSTDSVTMLQSSAPHPESWKSSQTRAAGCAKRVTVTDHDVSRAAQQVDTSEWTMTTSWWRRGNPQGRRSSCSLRRVCCPAGCRSSGTWG